MGEVAEAKRLIPRRVVVASAHDLTSLRELPEVGAVRQLESATNDGAGPYRRWEFELREEADPQALLKACFDRRLQLSAFQQTDPSLHDVFVRLVGEEAREAVFR